MRLRNVPGAREVMIDRARGDERHMVTGFR